MITFGFAMILVFLIGAFYVVEAWESIYKTKYTWTRRVIITLSCIVSIILILLTYQL